MSIATSSIGLSRTCFLPYRIQWSIEGRERWCGYCITVENFAAFIITNSFVQVIITIIIGWKTNSFSQQTILKLWTHKLAHWTENLSQVEYNCGRDERCVEDSPESRYYRRWTEWKQFKLQGNTNSATKVWYYFSPTNEWVGITKYLRVAVSVSIEKCTLICNRFFRIISHSLSTHCLYSASSAAASSETTTSTNNTHFIDIIVLEYATGTRGGHGLPYRLRREYLENALRAGVTFELWWE